MSQTQGKLATLRELMASMDSAAIAFSGGSDSTLVAKVAKDELGDRCAAVTIDSDLLPRSELRAAKASARAISIRHEVVRSDILSDPSFAGNPPDRCYICKLSGFRAVRAIADEMGLREVLDGSNHDDRDDHRPGSRARRELGVRSPLSEARMTKEDVRNVSRRLRLRISSKDPSPCLATRIPYGERITSERLIRIEKAEGYLVGKGFRQVRVRDHGDLARIEVSANQLGRLSKPDLRRAVVRRLKALGYTYVTLDLRGYRTGSLDEVLRR